MMVKGGDDADDAGGDDDDDAGDDDDLTVSTNARPSL